MVKKAKSYLTAGLAQHGNRYTTVNAWIKLNLNESNKLSQ